MYLSIARLAVFGFAASALLAGTLVSALAALALESTEDRCTKLHVLSQQYSTAICAVAFCNYAYVYQQLWTQMPPDGCRLLDRTNDRLIIDIARYVDWLVTMPLLAVKVLDMAKAAGDCSIDDGQRVLVAVLAFLMIACGVVVAAFACAPASPDRKPDVHKVSAGLGFALGSGCLGLLLWVLYAAMPVGTVTLYVFTAVWCVYPVVFVAERAPGSNQELLDCCYAVLDIMSKAVFAFFSVRICMLA